MHSRRAALMASRSFLGDALVQGNRGQSGRVEEDIEILLSQLGALPQVRDLYPGALLPALDAFFGELHALGAFQQAPAPRLVLDHVAEEQFPLALEGVVEDVLLGDLLPAFEIVERAVHVGVPNGARGVAVVLRPAVAQAGDGGALGAIDRKSTRLNSSHRCISYAVFCLKKKKKN